MMQPFIFQPEEWNKIILRLPGAHLLQTHEWAQVKNAYGWQVLPFVWWEHSEIVAAAMILKKSISISGLAAKLCILYCPKGPLLAWENESIRQRVLDDLQSFARQQGGIFIKVDPDVVLGRGIPGTQGSVEDTIGQAVERDLSRRGWRYSSSQVQFRNTVMIDLAPSEDEMLARMKQKTRYNIRLAVKKGVTIRIGTLEDLPMLYRMYAETSVRDGFVIRDQNYYTLVWTAFMRPSQTGEKPKAEPLIAMVDGEPVAAVFIFYFAGRAYYLYGMSRENHREKMPNHLLQWEGMRQAKARGCQYYDLWGAPDEFVESDSMWGVFKFKEGLGGEVVRTLGGWDYAPHPMWYKLYTEIMPRVLDFMRQRGKRTTISQLDS